MSLKKSYLKHCKDKNLEINENQIKIVQKLSEYYNLNFGQSFIKKLFKDKKNTKYYLGSGLMARSIRGHRLCKK